MSSGKHITLTITEACNLHCIYCYEGYKTTRKMDFETAVGILNVELNTDDDFEFVEIAFHGGEPLLEFDLIRRICEYTWERTFKHRYFFFATTNGTLLNDEMKAWFTKYSDRIMLGLSFDGSPEVHNHNRSNSYDKIDIRFFQRLWPNQPIKMTISDYTVPRLSKSIKHIHQLGFRVLANFAFGINWENTDLDVLDDELTSLIDYYVENPNIEVCSLLNQKFENIDSNFHRWCGAGINMKVYDVSGQPYPCHFFQEFAIGDRKSYAAKGIDFSDDRLFVDQKCSGCKLLPLCPTCYGFNYATTGSVSERDEGMCLLTKHCILAASMLLYKKLKRYSDEELSLTAEQRNNLMHGIYVVQKALAEGND